MPSAAFEQGPMIARIILTLAVALVAPAGARAASDHAAQLAASCQSCHRLDRNEGGIPALIGRDGNSIAAALMAYRADDRRSHIMHAVALSLTSEEITLVAHYLSRLGKRAKQP